MAEALLPKRSRNYLGFEYAGRNELKLGLLYALVLFIFPFLSSNQLLVGTIVNALLIKAAIDLKSKKIFAISIIPSIAAFSAGLIFGNLTHAILLMIPFIWAGNLALMVIVRKLNVLQNKGLLYTNLAAGTAKTALLFLAAAILFAFNLVPAIALTAFGIIQFATAEAGGIVVIISKRIYESRK